MSGGSTTFSPWTPGLPEIERQARLRELRALAHVLVGPTHPFTTALLNAINDPSAAEGASRRSRYAADPHDAPAAGDLCSTKSSLSQMSAPSITPPPSKAAARMRRYRERKRCGLQLVWIEADEDLKARLVDLGYLSAEAINDRKAVSEACTSLIDDKAYEGINRGDP